MSVTYRMQINAKDPRSCFDFAYRFFYIALALLRIDINSKMQYRIPQHVFIVRNYWLNNSVRAKIEHTDLSTVFVMVDQKTFLMLLDDLEKNWFTSHRKWEADSAVIGVKCRVDIRQRSVLSLHNSLCRQVKKRLLDDTNLILLTCIVKSFQHNW